MLGFTCRWSSNNIRSSWCVSSTSCSLSRVFVRNPVPLPMHTTSFGFLPWATGLASWLQIHHAKVLKQRASFLDGSDFSPLAYTLLYLNLSSDSLSKESKDRASKDRVCRLRFASLSPAQMTLWAKLTSSQMPIDAATMTWHALQYSTTGEGTTVL